MFTKQSDELIRTWIMTGQLDVLGKYLISGTIHGKPGVPVSELGRIEKIVKKSFTATHQYLLGKNFLSVVNIRRETLESISS